MRTVTTEDGVTSFSRTGARRTSQLLVFLPDLGRRRDDRDTQMLYFVGKWLIGSLLITGAAMACSSR